MEISVFVSDKCTTAVRKDLTWEELCSSLSKPLPADVPKSRLPMWSPAVFEGDQRAAANVARVSCLVYDVDEDPVPSAAQICQALGTARWFAHSSSSATLNHPRWRLVIELSRPVTREEHAKLWSAVAKQLGFSVGAASKDSSRAWYAPRRSLDGSFVCSDTKGTFVETA